MGDWILTVSDCDVLSLKPAHLSRRRAPAATMTIVTTADMGAVEVSARSGSLPPPPDSFGVFPTVLGTANFPVCGPPVWFQNTPAPARPPVVGFVGFPCTHPHHPAPWVSPGTSPAPDGEPLNPHKLRLGQGSSPLHGHRTCAPAGWSTAGARRFIDGFTADFAASQNISLGSTAPDS